MTPQEYARIRAEQEQIIKVAQLTISEAYDAAKDAPLPENLRPATPEDVRVGAIFWYPDTDEGYAKWLVVEEVRYPSDDFKAFISMGSRFGLHGAFVEVTE